MATAAEAAIVMRHASLHRISADGREYTATRRQVRAGDAIVAAIFVLLCCPGRAGAGPAAAHDIPADVLIQIFARPEGQRLHVLVRVPLVAMRDFNFRPATASSCSTCRIRARLDAALREAARLWIVPALAIDEDGRASRRRRSRRCAPRCRPTAALPISRRRGRISDNRRCRRTRRCRGTRRCSTSRSTTPSPPTAAGCTIDPPFARFGLRVVTVLRFRAPDHPERAFEFIGDPGLVALDPRWHQAAWRFVQLGFDHILDGIDHLLFLFCLVLPPRGFRPLAVVVTAFTVAHSITLFSAAFGYAPDALWFPPLIETLIAVSIVYMALENIVARGAA